jgi:SRSO17 transposase
VESADLGEWERELDGVVARIAPLFYRTESKRHGEQYLRGLLSPLARKNGWTIAEYVGEPEPKSLQRLLNLSPWDADALLAVSREYAMENLADPGAILVADPTGFAKKGKKSVGVQRQYSGTLGRVDNCQIATFLAYVSPRRDRVLIDHRLYLPEKSWMADRDRCAEAGVPAGVTFKTRPQQVREMIEDALTARLPFAWFTADEEFGQNPGLCDFLESERLPYVMAIPKNTAFVDSAGKIREIDAYARRLPPGAWQRRACGIGSKGYRVYDWALVDSTEPDHQYLIRRAIDDKELGSTGATTRTNPRSANSSTSPAHGGRSKSASAPARTKLDSITTRSAPGTRGTATSPSPSSPTPSSRSPHPKPEKAAKSRPRNEPEHQEPAPVRRRLIPLSLAEIRRLLHLNRNDEHTVAGGLRWSNWRRHHQADARRAHTRRHLQLQVLVI